MDSLQQMNRAMRYLEENLAGEIDFEKMAHIAGCSEYHFRRLFSFLAGMPLGEYIRRRKLSLAVKMLLDDRQVTDIALSLGYSSPDAFTKAFQAIHGVTPSRVRKDSPALKAFPPMTFRLTIAGGTEMDFRIVKKDAFSLVGVKKRITVVFEGVNSQIESLQASLTQEKLVELKALSDTEPHGILYVSANFAERTLEGSELDQYIGVATTKSAPDTWENLWVPASEWAVFTACGEFPKALQDTWAAIYAQWLPGSGFQLTGGPEILWSESPDTTKLDYKSEIWIPVKRAGN